MKHSIRAFSLMLALVMAVMLPVQAFAASENTRYISEIVTVSAGSREEAKALLEEAGYKMVEGNLNGTFPTGVYLGYKETDNKKDAITDIAAMNMLGKFSYSDYKQMMKDYKDNIEIVVSGIETLIEEYQLGYANETKNAMLAYTALNLFRDDDSQKTMGDYFLDYDFSDDAKQSMTDTLMQANNDIVMAMIRTLSFAGDPDDTTLIDRMSEMGPDGLEEKYAKQYATNAAFRQAMASEYGKVADTLYKDWDYFYGYLLDIEKNVARVDDSGNIELFDPDEGTEDTDATDTGNLSDAEKEVLETVDSLSEIPERLDSTTDFGFYTMLAITPYGEGTLLDFFKRPSAEIDKTELYVIADCMSDGQKKQVDFIGLKEILQGAFSGAEEVEEDMSEAVEQYQAFTENMETVSLFEGVDRSIFTDGVAFTSSAVNHEALTGQSWLDKLNGFASLGENSYWNTMTISCWAATCVLAAVGVTATVMRRSALEKLPVVTKKFEDVQAFYQKEFERYMNRWNGGSPALSIEENLADFEYENPLLADRFERCERRFNSVQRTVKITAVLKVAAFALLIVALAFDIYTIVDYFMQEKPTEEAIPHHIMATAMTAYGEDYVYYQTVKTLSGEAADVNHHEANPKTGWLVLYTTKDTDAGDPIRADDMRVLTGSKSIGENTSYAHLFNETAPVNLTDPLYTGVADKVGGTFLLFNREEAPYFASAISGGYAAILVTAAFAVGAGVGSLVTVCVKKKKSIAA